MCNLYECDDPRRHAVAEGSLQPGRLGLSRRAARPQRAAESPSELRGPRDPVAGDTGRRRS